jgi:hypothetical protein
MGGMKLVLVTCRKEHRLEVFGTTVLRTVIWVYEGRSNRLKKSAQQGPS